MEIKNLRGLYIAHRGIHNGMVIENTIPAFSIALTNNVPIELDINILKDGNIIVYHDYSLKRLFGIDRKLSTYNYEELKRLNFPNTNIHIPLLNDVLSLIKGKVLLVIEVKKNNNISYKEYCLKITSVLEKYPYDFVIKSFDIRIIYWFLRNTNYITGLLIADIKNSLYEFFKSQQLIRSILKPDFISVDYRIVDKKIIQNFRKKKPVLVWTIKDKNNLDKLKSFADSFVIDNFYF